MNGNNLVYAILSWFFSNFTFMLAMFLIVLIAACFLGRYIVISKKMLIASLGIIVLEGILTVFVETNYSRLINYITGIIPFNEVPELSPETVVGSLTTVVTNFVAFSYSFAFFMISYREKRFLRSLGSAAGLYGYYLYMQTVILYSFAYITGGDANFFIRFNGYDDGQVNVIPLFIYNVISFAVTAALVAYMFFHFYRKKLYYVIRPRNRWLFIVWTK